MAKMLKLFVRICSITVTAIIIIVAVCVVMSLINKDEQTNVLGYYTINIYTGSMEPKIPTGAFIVNTKPKSCDEIKVGDVITYKSTDSKGQRIYITHRVHEIKTDGGTVTFVTKGDANTNVDAIPVTYNNIVGIHSGIVVPFLGFLVMFYSSRLGLITVANYIFLFLLTEALADHYFPKDK